VNNFNTASLRFNDYINYFNKQFKPAKPDAEIRQMLDTCITSLELSRGKLAKIEPREESLQNNKQMLSKAMEDLQQKIDEQNAFLRKYFATAKAFRPALFRR
jgi:predicted ribosome quality control (RQC) complex YloA/Tae2 family protein